MDCAAAKASSCKVGRNEFLDGERLPRLTGTRSCRISSSSMSNCTLCFLCVFAASAMLPTPRPG
eukprot:CAMPEP_0204173474 /NCGR_PEP_ID=MMETSP0361-20130328/45022_1 /ASSEMBLY_ACC=CAM_ASM_000343 /TAXON_ID=268821 /ORGANISM="Scrippsiella Hangoei, Strain SHTV-5" /LENGTH=63 /DNA_ID=CAMNT_0051131775 /DNA_START=6 /DNA_END=194 /DNA_ORIENTATION=+